MKRTFATAPALIAALALGMVNCAQATFESYGSPLGFARTTFNNAEDAGPLLQVQVGSDSAAPGYAAFQFSFASSSLPANPEITAIYLEDGAYSQSQLFANPSSFPSVQNPAFSLTESSAGTQFGVGSPSPGLPGTTSLNPTFVNRAGFLASSTLGTGNGINQGEHATLFVLLNSGVTLADVLAALQHPVLNGGAGYELRFGLREVNDLGGPADGYVNLQTPEPATVGVWGVGIALALFAAWRRRTEV